MCPLLAICRFLGKKRMNLEHDASVSWARNEGTVGKKRKGYVKTIGTLAVAVRLSGTEKIEGKKCCFLSLLLTMSDLVLSEYQNADTCNYRSDRQPSRNVLHRVVIIG